MVNYASVLFRIVAGVGFVIIIARKLDVFSFALWGIIISASTMLAYVVAIWNYWLRRFYVRGVKEAPGTGLVLTILYGLLSTVIYVGIAVVEDLILGTGFSLMIAALPIPPLMILQNYFIALSSVSKPELRGYSNFIHDTLRLILAYIFVVVYRANLIGVIYAMTISLVLVNAYMAMMLVRINALKLRFSWDLVKQWFKAFYIPLLTVLQGLLRGGIRVIVSWVAGSEIPVAYLNVGLSTQTPILQTASSAMPALYARILKKPYGKDVEEVLRIQLMFAGFIMSTLIALSKPIASIYNPAYIKAHILIPIVAIYALIYSLIVTYSTVITGSEEVDREGIKSHKEIFKSSLFKIHTLILTAIISAILLAIPIILIFHTDHLKEASAIPILLITTFIPLSIYMHKEASKKVPHKFPLKECIIFIISGLIAFTYYIISGANNTVIGIFWRDLPPILTHVFIALAIYSISALILSSWVRNLVKTIFKVILHR